MRGLQRDARVGTGAKDDPEQDSDTHRDQRGNGEPKECPYGEACRIGDVPKVRDARDDRREDQGWHRDSQQLHEVAADA